MIRRATEEHLPIIQHLAHEIWPKAYAKLLTPAQIKNMLDAIYSPEALARQCADGHHFMIIYEDDQPVGFVSTYLEGDIIWIKKLYILPEKQGKSYGKQLLEAATRHFPAGKSLRLYVNRENHAAQAFYQSQGFFSIAEASVQMGDYHFIDFIFEKALPKTT